MFDTLICYSFAIVKKIEFLYDGTLLFRKIYPSKKTSSSHKKFSADSLIRRYNDRKKSLSSETC